MEIRLDMKIASVFLLSAIVFFGFGVVSVGASSLFLPPNNLGLVGYWSFEDGAGLRATDFSGNGHTGQFNNMEETDWVDGKRGQYAIELDGGSEYVEEDSGLVTEYPVTLTAWVKTTMTGVGNIVTIANSADNDQWFSLRVESGKAYAEQRNVGHPEAISTTDINDGEWHHVAAVYTGNTNRIIYVDGVNEDTDGSSVSFPTSLNRWSIGRIGDSSPGQVLTGSVDDVRIYNRDLSDSEISALYNVGASRIRFSMGAPTNGLMAEWTFNGSLFGTVATDTSGQDKNATTTGSVLPTLGPRGQGVKLDGSTGYLSASALDSSVYGTNARTISLWFNAASFDTGTADTIYKHSQGSVGGGSGMWIFAEDNGVSVGFNGHRVIFDKNNLSTNRWYHFVFVVPAGSNSGSTLGYIDGVLKSTVTEAGASLAINTLVPSTSDIGSDGGLNFYNGSVDDVRVYNRELSAAEVQGLYQLGNSKINTSQNEFYTSGLIALHSFNGADLTTTTSTDRSGQGNNGTLINGPTPAIGRIGQALHFISASSQYVDLGNTNNFTSGGFTLSAWFKLTTTGSAQPILRKRPASGNNGDIWIILNDAGDAEAGIYDGTNWSEFATSGINYFDNEWHHIAISANTSNFILYIDGVSVGTSSPNHDNSFPTTTSSWKIGGNTREGEYANGSIDEVRMYNRALSAVEIQELYGDH